MTQERYKNDICWHRAQKRVIEALYQHWTSLNIAANLPKKMALIAVQGISCTARTPTHWLQDAGPRRPHSVHFSFDTSDLCVIKAVGLL
jgi:hypothetical protein